MSALTEKIKGYKTYLWNSIPLITGVLVIAGKISQPEAELALVAADSLWEGGLIVASAINLALRKITTGPAGKLFRRNKK